MAATRVGVNRGLLSRPTGGPWLLLSRLSVRFPSPLDWHGRLL
jgi:hypothetical protein